MKNIIVNIVSRIVDKPDQVQVNEKMEGDQEVFEVKVDPEDVGKVIGRQGAVANAIRTIVKVIAMREGKRANIDIWSPNRKEKGGK
jgi:predicted RNA-binding protein YlqC (UPF0109 family)